MCSGFLLPKKGETVSIEMLTETQLEAGQNIAREGYELSLRLEEIKNPTLRGEDSLAGGIAGLWRQEALIAETQTQQLQVLGDAVLLLSSALEGQEGENLAVAEEVVAILVENNGDIDLDNTDSYESIGSRIHEASIMGSGGSFAELPKEHQDKSINQLRTALELFLQQGL